MGVIRNSIEAAQALTQFDNMLFGVHIIPLAVRAAVPPGTEVDVTYRGMFALREEAVSFRVSFSIKASEFFEAFELDVAVDYGVEPGYEFTKQAFLEFSNSIVAVQLRSYAQTISNGLLVEMGLPTSIIPLVSSFEGDVFAGEKLPEMLSFSIMEELRNNPELAI